MSERVIDVAARAAYETRKGLDPADDKWGRLPEVVRMHWRRTVLAVAEVLDREAMDYSYLSQDVLEREARSQPE